MCDLICDVISSLIEAVIPMESMHMYDKIITEHQKMWK